jgi:hypothetical protein
LIRDDTVSGYYAAIIIIDPNENMPFVFNEIKHNPNKNLIANDILTILLNQNFDNIDVIKYLTTNFNIPDYSDLLILASNIHNVKIFEYFFQLSQNIDYLHLIDALLINNVSLFEYILPYLPGDFDYNQLITYDNLYTYDALKSLLAYHKFSDNQLLIILTKAIKYNDSDMLNLILDYYTPNNNDLNIMILESLDNNYENNLDIFLYSYNKYTVNIIKNKLNIDGLTDDTIKILVSHRLFTQNQILNIMNTAVNNHDLPLINDILSTQHYKFSKNINKKIFDLAIQNDDENLISEVLRVYQPPLHRIQSILNSTNKQSINGILDFLYELNVESYFDFDSLDFRKVFLDNLDDVKLLEKIYNIAIIDENTLMIAMNDVLNRDLDYAFEFLVEEANMTIPKNIPISSKKILEFIVDKNSGIPFTIVKYYKNKYELP